jgi:hypothetical protein
MNWDDPTERYELIMRVGAAEYNRLHNLHRERSALEYVNGHAIYQVGSRFGPLFHVGNTNHAFRTLKAAQEFAKHHNAQQ